MMAADSKRQHWWECVEVARLSRVNVVRDSKDPEGDFLALGREAWAALLGEIKRGAHDL
ncbi:DUF397 domain-containing protein [Actinomadura craniellae]|uniref:DUF397 domain-containing protein n=1 Tax=Actinomadura craniellae TaxID=2231787 RepID=A0A365HBM6_9ACTN|nr:DUF397 domain-containing protein [Actinomadura craniellae]RAY16336.1 DUF397 domain-containing protein [Actinomadura craniellae]